VFVEKGSATNDAKRAFKQVSRELARRFGHPRLTSWTEDEVVETAPPQKKTVYAKARDSLLVKPIEAKDARVRMFVKPDKLTDVGSEPKKPRAIQGRSPRFNVVYGKYIKPIEHYLSGWKGVRRGVKRTRVFAKGLNWEERAELVMQKLRNFKRCVSLDASSFDASVRAWHLIGVHRVYRALIGHDPEFLWLLNQTLVNVGLTAHGIWYTIVGNRMSGDMDTGIGNSILAFMLVWTAVRKLGLRKWDLLCDGDDILVFFDDDVTQAEWVLSGAELGFDWKVEGSWTRGDPYESIEFCRHRLVEVGGTWRFTRGARALATFGVTHIHTGTAHLRYLKGVAMSELYASAGVPCAAVLSYEAYKRIESKALFVHSDLYKFGNFVHPDKILSAVSGKKLDTYKIIAMETRQSYCRAFGVSVEDQLAYERRVPEILDTYLFGPRNSVVDVIVEGGEQVWNHPELSNCVI